jgi:predicted nucleic acid-binding protein
VRALWDTSLWIAASRNPRFRPPGDPELEALVTCGPVVQEMLQGTREPFRRSLQATLLAVPRVGDPVGMDTFVAAAEIYQRGRDRGTTIASPVDCLIAAIAIAAGVEVWHLDRDYEAMAMWLPLQQRNLRGLV